MTDTAIFRREVTLDAVVAGISAANGSVVWRSGHFIMLLGNEAFTVAP